MTREEQLKFCSICKKKQMDFKKGILCSLTNEYAAFDESCPHFDADQKCIELQIIAERKLKASGGNLIGSRLFLWIGGLSMLNILLTFVGLYFVFGLVSTVLVQAAFVGIGFYIAGVALALCGCGFFIWTYYLTAKKELLWAYCAGWIIYLLDTLLYIPLISYHFEFSYAWGILIHIVFLMLLYCYNPLIDKDTWQSIKHIQWTHANIGYVVLASIMITVSISSFIVILLLSL